MRAIRNHGVLSRSSLLMPCCTEYAKAAARDSYSRDEMRLRDVQDYRTSRRLTPVKAHVRNQEAVMYGANLSACRRE